MTATRRGPKWLTLMDLLDELPDAAVPCRNGDPEAWWPDRRGLYSPATRTAVAACRGCAARDACLAYALAADEPEGVWGGTLPDERRQMRRAVAAWTAA